jgi:lipopolysaccharide transport system ATP-binding protein
MSHLAIKIENLSKKYKIVTGKHHHDTLRDQIIDGLKSAFRRNGEPSGGAESFWALKDISFEVMQGEVLGIIGRNGAGKSTLLKILSRITPPTGGRVELYGRVGSLLEVGTGFDRELSGRENIYLNGAILGMRKSEIDRKFDEIVAFSEVEKFIDTPVKRYSSGMYVRLAFAVAAHLEPEILIVDEVLAVGDAAFQKKCLGRMGEVAKAGRTILYVSHNMPSVQALTSRCLLLQSGCLIMDGFTPSVLDRYRSSMENIDAQDGQPVVYLRDHPRRLPGMIPALNRIWMTDARANVVTVVPIGAEITFHVEYEIDDTPRQPIVGITIETVDGQRVFGINNKMAPGANILNGPTNAILSCRIPRLPLVAGNYFVTVAFAKSVDADFDKVEKAYTFTVIPADVYGTGFIPVPENGLCVIDATWTMTSCEKFRKPAYRQEG